MSIRSVEFSRSVQRRKPAALLTAGPVFKCGRKKLSTKLAPYIFQLRVNMSDVNILYNSSLSLMLRQKLQALCTLLSVGKKSTLDADA